ncbi:hypothetical protein VTO58DRAFT_108603 [Aureobasidium pullulans]
MAATNRTANSGTLLRKRSTSSLYTWYSAGQYSGETSLECRDGSILLNRISGADQPGSLRGRKIGTFG